MNKRLNDYLDKKGAEALDEDVLKKYAEAMKKRTIPEVEREIRMNEERAAEMRFSPGTASRRQKGVTGNKVG